MLDRKASSLKHWIHSSWTTARVLEQGRAAKLKPLQRVDPAIFHDAVGVSLVPPGRLLNRGLNLQLYTLSHLPPWFVVWSSSHEKLSAVYETRLVSHVHTKVCLRPSPTGQIAATPSHPTSTPPHPKSRERLKRSFPHIQTSRASSLTISFGHRVQPSHGMIETPPRSY